MPPCLNVDGTFINAPDFTIAARVNERIFARIERGKKVDAFIRELETCDYIELEEIDVKNIMSHTERKRKWDNMSFHFGRDK